MNNIQDILTERGKTHGSFDNNALTIQSIKKLVRLGNNWENLDEQEREAIDMIIVKISRAACGTSTKDHYTDVAGYATLAANSFDQRSVAQLNDQMIKCKCASCLMHSK